MMKNKKVLSFLMATVVALSAFPTTVFAANSSASAEADANVAAGSAADTVQGQDTEQHKQSAYGTATAENEIEQSFDVYATKDSVSEVLLPKTVILNGAKAKSNDGYYVAGVKGDIAGDKQINIVPDSTVALSAAGQNDVTAEITQDKTGFIYADGINPDSWTLTTGKISANIAAGQWHGTFNFNNSCTVPAGYTTLYQYDVSVKQDKSVVAYYCVPNKNTSPVEILTAKKSKSRTRIESGNTVVEYNGVRYELSDDDVLVISGQGKMKDDIRADLIDYAGIENAVYEKFSGVNVRDYYHSKNIAPSGTKTFYYWHGGDNIYPEYCISDFYETESLGNGNSKYWCNCSHYAEGTKIDETNSLKWYILCMAHTMMTHCWLKPKILSTVY